MTAAPTLSCDADLQASSTHEGALLLAYYFAPQITSGVQRATRLQKFLPANGFRVHVLCSANGGTLDLANVEYLPHPTVEPSEFEVWVAARLQRVAPYNEQLPWVPHAVAAATRLIEAGKISAIISTSPPVGTHLAALLLKRRFPRLTWVADFRDPIAGNPNRARTWANGYDRFLERAIFSKADAIIGVTDAVVDGWRKRYPRWAPKTHLIWNGFDPTELPEVGPPPARTQKVLAHVGVIYVARQPNAIVDSLERLIRSGRVDPGSIQLRQIGQVEGETAFRERPSAGRLIASGCLEILSTPVPRRDALRETAASDFLLLLDIANLSKQAYTVPAKIFDYILTGRPILAVTPRQGPVERILSRCGVPSTIVYLDDPPPEVDRKLEQFLSGPTAPVQPSPWFFETFDGSRQAGAVADILAGIGHSSEAR